MSYRKNKGPKYIKKETPECSTKQVPDMINFVTIQKMTEEAMAKKLEENPRLEEFENIVQQYTNDYITFQIEQHNKRGIDWFPTTDSVYFCYTHINRYINGCTYTGDKEFRNWFNKEPISDIRQLISRELSIYRNIKKAQAHIH